MLTIAEFKDALPQSLRMTVDQATVDRYNQLLTDPDTQEMMRDNIISYSSVLGSGKFKLDDYINAVRYVSFKMMGHSNFEAYCKTFPDRYQAHMSSGKPMDSIHSYVSAYNKNKLVNLITEQTLIPTHILNRDIYQESINTLATIMRDEDVSPKVRVEAASKLADNLKQPETKRVQLDVNHRESSELVSLRQTLSELAAFEKAKIVNGETTTREVAHRSLFNFGKDED